MSHIRSPLEISEELDFTTTAFNKLIISEKESITNDEKLKTLLHYVDGVLYAWCETERCIATILTKNIMLGNNKDKYQLLRPTKPIQDDVSNIVINESGTKIAIVSENAIYIMIVPRRWGLGGGFEGDMPEISCSTCVLETLFKEADAQRVRWHPGSMSDDILLVLFSNNVLKMYDTSTSETKVRWSFANEFASKKSSHLGLSTDSAVDFAFVPQIQVKDDFGDGSNGNLACSKDLEQNWNGSFNIKTEERSRSTYNKNFEHDSSDSTYRYLERNDKNLERWTILILMGNGDVYYTYMYLSLDGTPILKFMSNNSNTLRGPLLMFPAAEDNYGVDTCSMLVLEGPPPIIIIASCTGIIYNCMLLPHSTDESYEIKQNRSLEESGILYDPPEYALHGLQSVEFDLEGVKFRTAKNSNNDDYSSIPIELVPDHTNKTRFFVVHMAGVHCVSMPIINEFATYFDQDTDEKKERFMPKFASSKCIADYILCTKSNLSNDNGAPVGMTSADLPMPVALTLTPNGITAVHLRAWNIISAFHRTPISTASKIEEVSLVEQVTTILHRKDGNPFLQLSTHKEVTPETVLEFLCKATGYFREDVIPRHYQAAQLLTSRKTMLSKMAKRQEEEIKNLLEQKKVLQAQAELLSEKYEERSEALIQLSKRAQKCITRVKTLETTMTDPEKLMRSKLEGINEKTISSKNVLSDIRKKMETLMLNKLQYKSPIQNISPSFNYSQETLIKDSLTKITTDIQDLVVDIKEVSNNMHLQPEILNVSPLD